MEFDRGSLVALQRRFSYPRFSDAEYERRYRNIRTLMDERDVDCLLIAGGSAAYGRVWSNVRYVSNMIGKADQCAYVVFPRTGEPTVIMGGHAETDGMVARSVVGHIVGPVPTLLAALTDVIRSYGCATSRVGLVEYDPVTSIPKNHWDHLTTHLPGLEIVPVTTEFLALRMLKSDEEIICLERSSKLNDLGLQALIDGVRPGIKEADAFAIVYDAVLRNDGELGMIQLASTSLAEPDLNDQRPRPVDRIIRSGDLLNTELGVFHNGYEAQSGKPIVLGRPSEECERLFGVAYDAYRRVAETLAPGRTSRDSIAAAQCILDAGLISFGSFVQGMYGYQPRYEPEIRFPRPGEEADEDLAYQVGMVFTVQPHVATWDRRLGVFLGDTYVVTPSGPRCLNGLEPKLYRV